MSSIPQPTQGRGHNVKLVDSGAAERGMITLGIGLHGWNGTGDWTGGEEVRNIRGLVPVYDTPFQAVVLRRSGIATLAELDKKRVGVGPRAGTGGTYIPAILKLFGISPKIINGSFEAVATELFAGDLDAFIALTGPPMPAIQQAEAKEPVTFIRLFPEQIEAIRKAMPEFSPSKMRAGTYPRLDKDFVLVGVYNFGVGRADLLDDLVY